MCVSPHEESERKKKITKNVRAKPHIYTKKMTATEKDRERKKSD